MFVQTTSQRENSNFCPGRQNKAGIKRIPRPELLKGSPSADWLGFYLTLTVICKEVDRFVQALCVRGLGGSAPGWEWGAAASLPGG